MKHIKIKSLKEKTNCDGNNSKKLHLKMTESDDETIEIKKDIYEDLIHRMNEMKKSVEDFHKELEKLKSSKPVSESEDEDLEISDFETNDTEDKKTSLDDIEDASDEELRAIEAEEIEKVHFPKGNMMVNMPTLYKTWENAYVKEKMPWFDSMSYDEFQKVLHAFLKSWDYDFEKKRFSNIRKQPSVVDFQEFAKWKVTKNDIDSDDFEDEIEDDFDEFEEYRKSLTKTVDTPTPPSRTQRYTTGEEDEVEDGESEKYGDDDEDSVWLKRIRGLDEKQICESKKTYRQDEAFQSNLRNFIKATERHYIT